MVAISQMTDKVQLLLATEHKQNYFLKESLVVFHQKNHLQEVIWRYSVALVYLPMLL